MAELTANALRQKGYKERKKADNPELWLEQQRSYQRRYREQCKAQGRVLPNYSQAYRERQLAENPIAFRARNAANMRASKARHNSEVEASTFPPTNPNWSAKLYRVVNDVNSLVYIGSTFRKLPIRLAQHQLRSTTCGGPLYILMREIGRDKFRIELIQDFPCDSREELLEEEKKLIQREGTLNYRVERRGPAEYYQQTREKHQERMKAWYVENNARLTTPNACGCGGRFTTANRTKHEKTARHQAYLATLAENQPAEGDSTPPPLCIADGAEASP